MAEKVGVPARITEYKSNLKRRRLNPASKSWGMRRQGTTLGASLEICSKLRAPGIVKTKIGVAGHESVLV